MNPIEWARVKAVFLGALGLPPAERDGYVKASCGGDQALEDEVRALLGAHDAADTFLESPVPVPESLRTAAAGPVLAGASLGPYRIESEVGRGGMGVVYRARREGEGYTQEVALKLVHPALAVGRFTERLKLERRILATLEHPNIARLIDGGATADGQPYYAMEFVDGRPLDAFCVERGLGLRARLELFCTVCDAVAFAHRRLIVHRDLKPGNVLVSADGVPKLLDFGIAKLLAPGEGDDLELTATGMSMMTPDYASPEQVRGEPVSTATDVYALGMMLYVLVAGRRPYELVTRSHEEIVRRVCDEVPPLPSEVVGAARREVPAGETRTATWSVDTDLDTIAAKAIRKEPARRYGSASELADDVRRYLDGLPVQARPDTIGYRTSRFVRRHKVAVSVSAVALLAVLAGAGVAVYQARVAHAQRLRADERFKDVRGIAKSLVFELHDSIEDIPGTTAARQLILKRAAELLDVLSADAPDDPTLGEEVAAAYHRLGDVLGGAAKSNLGDLPSSLAAHRRGLEIRRQLAAAAPLDPVRQERFASSLIDVSYSTQDANEALGYAKAAYEIASRLAAVAPSVEAYARRRAAAGFAVGLHLVSAGRFSEAAAEMERVTAEYDSLLAKHPGDDTLARNTMLAHKRLGAILLKEGRPTDALPHYTAALASDEARLAAQPNSTQARYDLSVTLVDLGITRAAIGDTATQLANLARALELREDLLRADPQNMRHRLGVVSVLQRLAGVLVRTGRPLQAQVHARRALGLLRADDRTNQRHIHVVMADSFGLLGQWEQAVSWASSALDMAKDAADASPSRVAEQVGLAWTELRLADALAARAASPGWRGTARGVRSATDARAHYRAALALAEGLQQRGVLVGDDARLPTLATEGLARVERGRR